MDELTPLAKYTLVGFVLFVIGLMGAVLIAIAFKRDIGTALMFLGILFGIVFLTFSMTSGLADAINTFRDPPHKRRRPKAASDEVGDAQSADDRGIDGN